MIRTLRRRARSLLSCRSRNNKMSVRLHVAIVRSDWSKIERALNEGADINNRTVGYTPLLCAIGAKHWDVVFRLLDVAGIDVNLTSPWGLTPIVEASDSGSLALIQKLVAAGANPHHRDAHTGATALFKASLAGNAEVVEYLLVYCGCGPNVANERGFTPLHNACSRRHHMVAALLLDHGADIQATGIYRQTPLHIAAKFGDRGTIQLLLDRLAPPEDENNCGQTALHLAAVRWGSSPNEDTTAVVRELLDRRANVSRQDQWGKTALDRAINFQNIEVGEMLLKAYSDQLLREHGCLAFHNILRELIVFPKGHDPGRTVRVRLAVGTLTMGLFRTLIHSFDHSDELIRALDDNDNGALPIHVACGLGVKDCVLRILVELDPATLRLPNAAGALPVHLLCGSGRADVKSLQYLVEQGGIDTLRTRDQNGASPMHHLLGAAGNSSRLSLKCMVDVLLKAYPDALSVATHDGDVPIMVASEASCSEDILFLLMKECPTALIR